jgi:uncharacterized protein
MANPTTPKPAPKKLFVNMAVRDPKRSMEYFKQLGFEFNPQFTDDNAACMVLSDEASVMLLAEPYFKTFTKKELCKTATQSEALFAFSAASRADVDDIVKRAVAAGGSHAMEPADHGWMYIWSFYDLDDHHWEVLWVDPLAVPK